ncbi:carbohydrate ABC transporter permease [Oceaniovalibus sp. ACAM 378]|uniref:carbohydrate ABC transporter permease n=1 Tax=Oceaniovalibus sp. ACAM 378 TaxID=2599923 RepID=UPI0011D8D86D|nr:sugar ABC transporter permease [Oceaniovalibus sp. ACAM 378]TYB84334.1 sugar ABC transporter permease [Oceaniovalibus sp. ACAM 378]
MRIRNTLPYTFLVPTVLLLIVLAFTPLIYAVMVSFTDRTLFEPTSSWVGFENYSKLLGDRRFVSSAWVSLKWEVVTVSATMLLAVGLGVLMFETASRRQRAFFSLVFLVPVLLPRVCAAFVWKFAFHPLYGIITFPYRAITGRPLDVLSDPNSALLAVAFVDVWQWGFFFAVIVLKLLESLPPQPIEAARLDNAKPWEIHFYITLPMLKAPLVSLALVKAIESLRSFDLIYVMTRGGPGIATETLDMYAFSQGFIESGNIAYASAIAVIMLIATIVIFTVIWKRVNR